MRAREMTVEGDEGLAARVVADTALDPIHASPDEPETASEAQWVGRIVRCAGIRPDGSRVAGRRTYRMTPLWHGGRRVAYAREWPEHAYARAMEAAVIADHDDLVEG